jgi:membrane protease YdiL (CAAX protease family)
LRGSCSCTRTSPISSRRYRASHAGAAAFALFNALFEELIWRGVFQSRLTALFGSPLAIVLQAVSFGVAHAHGFPRGVVGVALVTVWALMLGALRARAAGLLAPLLAHVVADATIACVLVLRAR